MNVENLKQFVQEIVKKATWRLSRIQEEIFITKRVQTDTKARRF